MEFIDNKTVNKGIIINYEVSGGNIPLEWACHEYLIFDQDTKKLYFGGSSLTGKGVVNLSDTDINELLRTINQSNLKKFRELAEVTTPDIAAQEFVIMENGMYNAFVLNQYSSKENLPRHWDGRPFTDEQLKAFENVRLIVTQLERLCDCTKDSSE